MKLVLFVIAAIVAWLMITQPDTSGPIVGEILRATGAFLQDVLLAVLKLLGQISDIVRSR